VPPPLLLHLCLRLQVPGVHVYALSPRAWGRAGAAGQGRTGTLPRVHLRLPLRACLRVALPWATWGGLEDAPGTPPAGPTPAPAPGPGPGLPPRLPRPRHPPPLPCCPRLPLLLLHEHGGSHGARRRVPQNLRVRPPWYPPVHLPWVARLSVPRGRDTGGWPREGGPRAGGGKWSSSSMRWRGARGNTACQVSNRWRSWGRVWSSTSWYARQNTCAPHAQRVPTKSINKECQQGVSTLRISKELSTYT